MSWFTILCFVVGCVVFFVFSAVFAYLIYTQCRSDKDSSIDEDKENNI